MSIEFACTECNRELKVNDRAAGRRVRCPHCGGLLVVPDPADETAVELEEASDLEEVADLEELTEGAIDEPAAEANVERAAVPIVEPPIVVRPKEPPRVVPPTKPRAAADRADAASGPIQLPPHRPHPEDLIDMTAMVDIVFFLLIFFLVTSLQSLESVMNMPTPQSAEGGASAGRTVADLENDPNYITVRIEDDDSIWVEDTQVFNDQDLGARLRTAQKAADRPRSLLVLGSADASHGAAVRVFDAGAGAGVNNISLLVQEQLEGAK
jgi:biopolymer transport protein ExbD/DNA-directed RNA polymerase subunit RPC12/RpoP